MAVQQRSDDVVADGQLVEQLRHRRLVELVGRRQQRDGDAAVDVVGVGQQRGRHPGAGGSDGDVRVVLERVGRGGDQLGQAAQLLRTEQIHSQPVSYAAKSDAAAFYRHNRGSKFFSGVL